MKSTEQLEKTSKRAVSISDEIIVLKKVHYNRRLLLEERNPSLRYNRELAVQRLYKLERKWEQNPELAEKHRNAINKYLDLGYALQLRTDESVKSTDISKLQITSLHH